MVISMKSKILLLLTALFFCSVTSEAQITLRKAFDTKPVYAFANASFCIIYTSDGEVLNLRNFPAAPSMSGATNVLMNPAKSSYAVMKDRKYIAIYSYLEENKELFNLKHIQLDTRLDDYQSGPSLMETRDRYEACFNDFAEYVKDIDDPVLKEDYIQLEYAVNTLNYMYNKAKLLLDKGDEETEKLADFYKEKLKQTTAPLRGYDFGNKFINGLTTIGVHEQ